MKNSSGNFLLFCIGQICHNQHKGLLTSEIKSFAFVHWTKLASALEGLTCEMNCTSKVNSQLAKVESFDSCLGSETTLRA